MPIFPVNEVRYVTESSTYNEEMCDDERHVLNLLNNGILEYEILRAEQMNDEDLQKNIEFKKAGDIRNWSDISNLSSIFKYY